MEPSWSNHRRFTDLIAHSQAFLQGLPQFDIKRRKKNYSIDHEQSLSEKKMIYWEEKCEGWLKVIVKLAW